MSNPTPHPGMDDAGSIHSGNGVIDEGPTVPPSGGMVSTDESRFGQDAVMMDHDGDEDAEDTDDVGPEDGGGSTEPMG